MDVIDLPSKEVLDQVLKYDPDTGMFRWRPRPVSMFNSGTCVGRSNGFGPTGPRGARDPVWSCNQWNSRWAGKPAASQKAGYWYVRINYQAYLAHRVAYKIMTGLDPVEIDHIDGDRGNNRWSNLKNGTRSDNMRNVRLKYTNKSGAHGVHFSKRQQKWTINIGLGSFDSKEEAIAARKAAEVLLGFHPNHGRGLNDTNPAA